MSEAQATLAALRQALEALQKSLTTQVALAGESAGTVELDQPIGRLTRMDAMQQQSMARANRQAAKLRLRQVDAALARHDAGTYGICLSCGDDIAPGRLRARPETTLCLECQSEREGR